MRYVMLTIVTKYSRIPEDAEKLKWYNAIMETGKTPVTILPDGVTVIREALRKKGKDLQVKILCLAILPDHIHIVLDIAQTEDEIGKIIQMMKGYSAYMYNKTFQGTLLKQGKQNKLRASGYALTFLEKQDHLVRAIQYVDTNHMKHSERRGEEFLHSYICTSDKRKPYPLG